MVFVNVASESQNSVQLNRFLCLHPKHVPSCAAADALQALAACVANRPRLHVLMSAGRLH